MAKSKEILAAGVVRDIRFATPDLADEYLYRLDHRGFTYKVLQSCRCDNGTVILSLVVYNCDLNDLCDY